MAKKDGKFAASREVTAGILMLEYVAASCERVAGKNMQGQKMVYKSFVSSPFAEDIARKYRVYIKNVPTGFKNIALEMERSKRREENRIFCSDLKKAWAICTAIILEIKTEFWRLR